MTVRNPKQEGTPFWDCIPKVAHARSPAPVFLQPPGCVLRAHRPAACPNGTEVGDGIVRMNCGNDSNNRPRVGDRDRQRYKRFFFNTSIPRYDFPGPVVLTANPKEEDESKLCHAELARRRLVLASREPDVRAAPHVGHQPGPDGRGRGRLDGRQGAGGDHLHGLLRPRAERAEDWIFKGQCYEWRVRHINSYWCPTKDFMRWVMSRYGATGS